MALKHGAEQDHYFFVALRENVEEGDHAQLAAAFKRNRRAHDRHPDEQVDGDLFGGGK